MKLLRYALLLFCGWAALPSWAGEPLHVSDAWVREGPPTARVLGGFMTLKNPAAQAVHITGITSPDFGRVEMHRSVTENGMARMLRQDRLTVPAGGELVLAPGGLHLMLYQPKQPMGAGQKVQLLLHTEAGAQLTVQAQIRAGMGHAMEHHHHHH